MKKALLGIGLILYSMWFTPCFWEPSDIVVSTGYIATVYALYPTWAPIILALWIMSGYIALVWGIVLLGHSLTKYTPFLKPLHGHMKLITLHPLKLTLVIVIVSLVITYFMIHNGGIM